MKGISRLFRGTTFKIFVKSLSERLCNLCEAVMLSYMVFLCVPHVSVVHFLPYFPFDWLTCSSFCSHTTSKMKTTNTLFLSFFLLCLSGIYSSLKDPLTLGGGVCSTPLSLGGGVCSTSLSLGGGMCSTPLSSGLLPSHSSLSLPPVNAVSNTQVHHKERTCAVCVCVSKQHFNKIKRRMKFQA